MNYSKTMRVGVFSHYCEARATAEASTLRRRAKKMTVTDNYFGVRQWS